MDGIQITALVPRKVVIPYADFPQLLNAHLARNKSTQTLEGNGFALRTGSTIVWQDLETFIRQVCAWGDYSGIAGRVLKNNPQSTIVTRIQAAISKLNSSPPDLVVALENVMKIKHLGQVSFASKHLRFLLPAYCPVLDSILSNRLFYDLSPTGYGSFCISCMNMAADLNKAGVACSFPGVSIWRPSDVEAALYAWVNGWK